MLMSNGRKQVRFAISYTDEDRSPERPALTSERGLERANIGIWLALAALLWLLIAIAIF